MIYLIPLNRAASPWTQDAIDRPIIVPLLCQGSLHLRGHVAGRSGDKTIGEARKLAQEIEGRARRTAAHISVEEAQKQFKLAQQDHNKRVKLWGYLSVIAIAAFFAVAVYLARVQFPEEWRWHVVYFAAIRITILTAAAAVATFCLRVLRAHMHMSVLAHDW